MNVKKLSIAVILALVTIIVIIPTVIVTPFIGADTGDNNARSTEVEVVHEPLVDEDSYVVSVFRSQQETVDNIPLEEYVAGVVASEMPADFELEALKAQALAARTYVVKYVLNEKAEDDPITDTVQHQVYKSEEELREIWGADFTWKMKKIEQAVAETKGEIITYEGEPITPTFFSTSNGFTENAEDYWENPIPYLVSVESPWDEASPKYLEQKIIPVEEASQALGVDLTVTPTVGNLTRTSSNRVNTVEIAGQSFSGRDVREALDLQSSDFTVELKNDHLIFKTKGYGHGVGMSQYGANGMALEGNTYKEILNHFYKGIEITEINTDPERVTALKQ